MITICKYNCHVHITGEKELFRLKTPVALDQMPINWHSNIFNYQNTEVLEWASKQRGGEQEPRSLILNWVSV